MTHARTNTIGRYRHRALCVALLAVACVAAGCTSPAEGPHRAAVTSPGVEQRPPAEMDALIEYLLVYHARHGALPADLATLADEGIMAAEAYDALPAYAYSPGGLGELADGRLVVVVDDIIRVPNRAWCILREPAGRGAGIVLRCVLVPMSQLHAAARAADRAAQQDRADP